MVAQRLLNAYYSIYMFNFCFHHYHDFPYMDICDIMTHIYIDTAYNYSKYIKSHEMDSLWVPVRNSGGHIISLFKKYTYLIDYILLYGR